MVVETFIDEEIAVVNQEEKELMLEMAQNLGLSKQVELMSNDNHVNCYRNITAEELFVYGTNFPNTVKIEEYSGVIPLRVMQVVAHYKELFPGYTVNLMCPEPGFKDPVVVGSKYYWQIDGESHLLCRFGEALEEFHVLKERAIKKVEEAINLRRLNYTDLRSIANIVLK